MMHRIAQIWKLRIWSNALHRKTEEDVLSSSWSSSFLTKGCAIADVPKTPLRNYAVTSQISLQMQQSKRRGRMSYVFESLKLWWEIESENNLEALDLLRPASDFYTELYRLGSCERLTRHFGDFFFHQL